LFVPFSLIIFVVVAVIAACVIHLFLVDRRQELDNKNLLLKKFLHPFSVSNKSIKNVLSKSCSPQCPVFAIKSFFQILLVHIRFSPSKHTLFG